MIKHQTVLFKLFKVSIVIITVIMHSYKHLDINWLPIGMTDLFLYLQMTNKAFPCETCPKTFRSNRELSHHTKRIHECSFSYMCDQCSKPFVDSYDLKRHIANIHATIKRFTCGICSKGFGTRSHYVDHMTKVHDKKAKVACEYCGKMMYDKKVLKRHIMNKHNRDSCPHQCPICLKKFPMMSHLVRHISKSHEKHDSLQCQFCEQVFVHQLCVDFHIKKTHALQMLVPPPVPSEDQPKKSEEKKKKPKVKQEPSTEDKTQFLCDICNMGFSNRKGYTRHIKRVHEKQGRVKCEQCGKVVCSETNLKRHILSVHSKANQSTIEAPKPFHCEICEKGFNLKKSLAKHMKSVHTKEGRARCQYCGKQMSSENSLAQHIMIVHDRDQCPYECEFCGKKFSRDSHLTRHLEEVHYNELQENETCEHCLAKFHNQVMLQMHVKRVHKDHKVIQSRSTVSRTSPALGVPKKKIPQECEHCGKVLADQDTLKKHVLSMHNRSACPFKCHFCNKRFVKNSALLRHKKYVHDVETSEEELEDIMDATDYAVDVKKHGADDEEVIKSEIAEVKVKIEQVEGDVEVMKIEPEIDHHEEMVIKQEIKEEVTEIDDVDNDYIDDVDIEEEHQIEQDDNLPFGDDGSTQYPVEKFEYHPILNEHDTEDDQEKKTMEYHQNIEESHQEAMVLIDHVKKVTDFVKCQLCLTVFQSSEDCDAHACIEAKVDEEEAAAEDEEEEQNSSFSEELPPDELPFKCDRCSKQYVNRGSLRRHIREDHEDPEKEVSKVRGHGNICTLCDTLFDQSYLLKLHLKKAHNVTDHVPGQIKAKHKCKLCDKVYCRKESVRRHIREDHEGRKPAKNGETFQCQQCDKAYDRKDTLRRHVRIVHEAAQAGYCDSCDGAFFRDITRHVIVAHTNQDQPVECPECGKTIGKNYSLKRHLKDCHEAMSPKLCDLCGASCKNRDALKQHKKNVHKRSLQKSENEGGDENNVHKWKCKTKKFPCPHCEKSIAGRSGLRTHIRTIHEKIRDFMCQECGKAFTQNVALQLHIKGVHSEEKKAGFACPKCDKIWTSERGRQLHMEKTHNEKYTYSCQTCPTSFDSKASLRIHLKICSTVKT